MIPCWELDFWNKKVLKRCFGSQPLFWCGYWLLLSMSPVEQKAVMANLSFSIWLPMLSSSSKWYKCAASFLSHRFDSPFDSTYNAAAAFHLSFCQRVQRENSRSTFAKVDVLRFRKMRTLHLWLLLFLTALFSSTIKFMWRLLSSVLYTPSSKVIKCCGTEVGICQTYHKFKVVCL